LSVRAAGLEVESCRFDHSKQHESTQRQVLVVLGARVLQQDAPVFVIHIGGLILQQANFGVSGWDVPVEVPAVRDLHEVGVQLGNHIPSTLGVCSKGFDGQLEIVKFW